MNNIKNSGFNENEFETLMNFFYFKYFSLKNEFNIFIPTRQKESKLGYDFSNRKGIPLFLQYKVPKYCTRNSSATFLKNRKAKSLNKNTGCFYFNLHSRDQHNKLFSYKINNYYVSPLFYKRTILYKMFNQLFIGHNIYNDFDIDYFFVNEKKRIIFSKLNYPILDAVIYIQPHAKISDSNPHKYAYDMDLNVSFHSDESYELKGKYFYQILDEILDQEPISLNNLSDNISSSLKEIEYINPSIYSKILSDLFDETIETRIDSLESFYQIISDKYDKFWKLIINSLLLQELFGIEIIIIE